MMWSNPERGWGLPTGQAGSGEDPAQYGAGDILQKLRGICGEEHLWWGVRSEMG